MDNGDKGNLKISSWYCVGEVSVVEDKCQYCKGRGNLWNWSSGTAVLTGVSIYYRWKTLYNPANECAICGKNVPETKGERLIDRSDFFY